MKLSTLKLVSGAVLGMVCTSPAIAAEAVVDSKQTADATAKQIMANAVGTTHVRSGLLFALGKSELKSFDVTESLTTLGYTGVTGGEADAEMGFSLGYRHAFGARWSADMQYIRQNVSSNPIGVTVTTGTEAAAAQKISDNLPKLAQGLSLVGLYHAPLSARLTAHYGGGAFIWRGERETKIGTVTATDEESGTDLMLQLGLGYRFTPNVTVEGSLQRFFMPDEAVNRLSLGMVYSFQ